MRTRAGLLCVLLLLASCRGVYEGEARTVGELADDTYITTAINAKLVGDSELSAVDIDVDSYRGVVSLHGSVRSAALEARAVELARAVKGVREVKSRLVVVPD
jgi:hyperosmotically inducible protein